MDKSILGSFAKQFGFGETLRKSSNLKAVVRVNDDLITEFSKGLHYAYLQTVPSHMADKVPDVMMLSQYLKALVQARVMQTANQRLPFKAKSREWVIPAVFFPALGMIGKVQNAEYLIDIEVQPLPKVERTVDGKEVREYALMLATNAEWFHEVREFMVAVEGQHTVAYGLPVDEKGSYEFMMFQVVEGALMHHLDKVDPATALVASFIHAEVSQTIFAPRFIYGRVEDATVIIRQVTRARTIHS